VTDDCGCCVTGSTAIPTLVQNRPGLSALAYRIGTFARFRQAILEVLSKTPELAGLRTRVEDDYAITTIDLWCAVADVLTFYQERTFNEAFLRTATLRDSVLRLVRLIDYELRPGAAATTRLAFTLDSGATALIPIATRVQSVPGQGETPQKFETLAPVMADARLNSLRIAPAPLPANPTAPGTSAAIIAPDADALTAAATLARGDLVALYAPDALETLSVQQVTSRDDTMTVTWQAPISGPGFTPPANALVEDYGLQKLGRSFHIFGFNAPPTVVVAELKTPGDPTSAYLSQASTDFGLEPGWTSSKRLSLDGRYEGLKPGARLLVVWSVAGVVATSAFEIKTVAQASVERTATPAGQSPVTALSGTVTQVTLNQLGTNPLLGVDIRQVVIYELLGERLRFWPFMYPDTVASSTVCLPGRRVGWSSVELGRTIDKGVLKPGVVLDASDFQAGRAVLLTDAKGSSAVGGSVVGASLTGSQITFAPTDTDSGSVAGLGLAPDQVSPVTALVAAPLVDPVTLTNARRELTVTIGSLPTQTIALNPVIVGGGHLPQVAAALRTAIRSALPSSPTFSRALTRRIGQGIAIVPGVAGDRIAFGPSKNDTTTVVDLGLDTAHVRLLDGVLSAPTKHLLGRSINGAVRVTIGLNAPAEMSISTPTLNGAGMLAAAIHFAFGATALVTADQRVVVLPPPPPQHEERTFLQVTLDLDAPIALDSATAVLLGNVAPSSHGETVRKEILGDGDSSQSFQHFALKKKPVTFVPAATPGGVASSLQVLVDGVMWTEKPTLFNVSPRDQVYVTRIADDATLTVQFGDGSRGARPSTGRQNIVAQYRQGIGVAGRVGAAKLTTLLDRPTGVKGSINPIAADGGADPETMARAREAAPGTVRTFGRAVSLRDFEDKALLAGEVAKVSATWVWTGHRRAIHLTVAGQGGARFSSDGLQRITATLATERDPNHALLVDNYGPVPVLVEASIIVDDRNVTAQVLAAARSALLDALSFDVRRFAQPVYLSDVFSVLQGVAGVVAADVARLDLKNPDAAFRAAHGVDDTLGQPQPHLLTLPARPGGTSSIVLPAELAQVEVPDQDVILHSSGGLLA
jgi:hypothetical protein